MCCYVCFLKESGYLTSFENGRMEFGRVSDPPFLILGKDYSFFKKVKF